MTSDLPDLMFAWHDVELTFLFDYLRWYREIHGPDAIEMGHYTARSYLCRSGTPLMCNVYETPGVDQVWSAPRYQQIRDRDVDRANVLAHITNKSNTSYRQVATWLRDADPGSVPVRGFDPVEPADAGAIVAARLTTLSFDAEADCSDDLVAWCEGRGFDLLARDRALRSARLCRRAGRLHPDTPSDEPEWMVLAEWDEVDEEQHAGLTQWFEEFQGCNPALLRSKASAHVMELVHVVSMSS